MAEAHHHHADSHDHAHHDDPAEHDAVQGHHPHEVHWSMWAPVAVLAGLAVVSGFLNVPHSLHALGGNHFDQWVGPLLYQTGTATAHGAVPAIEYVLQGWATLVWAPGAMLLAWWIYGKDPSWARAKAFVSRFPRLFRWVHHKYYVDEFYEATVIGPCKQLGAQLWAFDAWVVDGAVNGVARVTLLLSRVAAWFDTRVVDGLVNLVAWLLQQGGRLHGALQSGHVQHYAFVMFLGLLVLALWRFTL